MCFCFTSNENFHFSSEKSDTPQNWLLIFLWKETHSETRSWKSLRILRVSPNFFIFCFVRHFFFFFHCFIFSFFSVFLLFHWFIFFSIFHFSSFLSFSFIFFHFLCLCWVLKIGFFLGLNFVTISLDSSCVKNQFWSPSRGVCMYPLWALFSLFSILFFCFFLSFFLLFICHAFSFLFISSFFDF